MTSRLFDVTPPGYTGASPLIMAELATVLPRASNRIASLTFTRKTVSVRLGGRGDWTEARYEHEAEVLRACAEGAVANVRVRL